MSEQPKPKSILKSTCCDSSVKIQQVGKTDHLFCSNCHKRLNEGQYYHDQKKVEAMEQIKHYYTVFGEQVLEPNGSNPNSNFAIIVAMANVIGKPEREKLLASWKENFSPIANEGVQHRYIVLGEPWVSEKSDYYTAMLITLVNVYGKDFWDDIRIQGLDKWLRKDLVQLIELKLYGTAAPTEPAK